HLHQGTAAKAAQAYRANALQVVQARVGRVPRRSKTLFDFPMVSLRMSFVENDEVAEPSPARS
ncbi:MAG: hypothetical protein WCE40_01220, partial [Polyangia bacterium]